MSESTNIESANAHVTVDRSVEIDIEKNGFIDKDGKLTIITSNTWGFINKEGKVVIPPIYDSVYSFSEGLASVHSDEVIDTSKGMENYRVVADAKNNFIDKTGKVVIPLNDYYVDQYYKGFKDGLVQISLGWGEGFMDKDGKIVIPTKYGFFGNFSEGLIYVYLDDKHGFVDTTGKEVVPLIYDDACDFSEGLAQVSLSGKCGFVDTTGTLVLRLNDYDFDRYYSEGFREGLAQVSLGDKWGFVDKAGKEVIPLIYDTAYGFIEGLAQVELDGKWGFIDTTGKEIIPLIYDAVDHFDKGFRDGLAKVKLDDKWGFIDTTGKVVVPLIYDDIEVFSEGLAQVRLDWKYGFVNTTGTVVIPMIYDNYSAVFSEGFAQVELDGKWGFVDTTGTVNIPMIYDNVGNFSEGLAKVSLDGQWGFIDKTGKEVIPLKYHGFGDFCEGLAKVFFNGKDSFANSLLHIKKLELAKIEGSEKELLNYSDEKQKLLQSAFWQETVSDDNYHPFVKMKETEYACSSPVGGIDFGVEFGEDYGWISLSHLISVSDLEQFNLLDIIKPLTSFCFYLGSECESLIQEFVNSDYTQTVERLLVGRSSFGLGGGGTEYAPLTNILAQAHYPNIKEFELGCWKLYSNSHVHFGSLGSVTSLLENMPNLEKLGLYGNFLFEKPIELLELETLKIRVEGEINPYYKQVSQNTLDNMLNSRFPNITTLVLNTGSFYNRKRNNKEVIQYTFTDDFCNGKSFPKLNTLTLNGNFAKEALDKLNESKFAKENAIEIRDYTNE